MTTETTQNTDTDTDTDQDTTTIEAAPFDISLIDLYLLADLIIEKLGDGWHKADDSIDPETIHFAHQDGRTFGIRRLWNGSAAQTFARDPEKTGPHYNAACHFTTAEAPLDTLLDTLHLRLFPVFQGHRAKLRYDGTRIPVTTADEPAPQQSAQPETPAAPTGEPAARKTTVKKSPAKKPAPTKPAPKAAAKKPSPAGTGKPAAKRPAKKASTAARPKAAAAQPKRTAKPKAVPAAA
ncbi:hypothetical protein OEIGOIKO_03469 [Streptomyces chrestomyceticus JCM 4735]|uniref:Uncharacterized protein n=1 Tax=Streptomyces chrestomyceticus JCM 4735 TaxID=1306181 RepID=A0A7U9PXW3_9ACTN|nr:hypothetical protein [Streptomyces chrestomyceticus]GCD35723.1 hypothetical protein OEIGOIKO_03469 [Streptomyces chrestomyceticus JCM 4735]